MQAKDKIIRSPNSEIHSILKYLDKIPYKMSILLTGPTGTGKELLADHIEENNSERKGAFNKINCTGLTGSLADSILFGHVKGAFTGAHKESKGLIELSNEGTLLLDEIGNLPDFIQGKLLRVLEDKKVQKLGDSFSNIVKVDVKFIGATNKPEKMLIDLKNRFDYCVEVPPLRKRPSDIPYLLSHFLESTKFESLDLPSLLCIASIYMQGNVRELRQFVNEAEILRSIMVDEGKLLKGTPESTTLLFYLYYIHISHPKAVFAYFHRYLSIRQFTSFDKVVNGQLRGALKTLQIKAPLYNLYKLDNEFLLQVQDDLGKQIGEFFIRQYKYLLNAKTGKQLKWLTDNPNSEEIGINEFGKRISSGVTLKHEYIENRRLSIERGKAFGVPWKDAQKRFHRAYIADLLKHEHGSQKELYEDIADISKSAWGKWKKKFPETFNANRKVSQSNPSNPKR